MRVRLLITTTVPDEDLARMAEMIAEQPPTDIVIRSGNGLGIMALQGRFIGAQQDYGPE